MSEIDHIEVGSCPVCFNICQIVNEGADVKYVNLKVPPGEIQDAVGAILAALGLPVCARGYSTKGVIYNDIIPAIQTLESDKAELLEALMDIENGCSMGDVGGFLLPAHTERISALINKHRS